MRIALCMLLLGGGALAASAAAEIPAVDRVRFFPAPGAAQLMVGGQFVASNGPDLPNIEPQSSAVSLRGFKVLVEIRSAPAADQWTEIKFANHMPYRWLAYAAPPGSHGKVAEIEFYAGERKLLGRSFDSFSPHAAARQATDGDTKTIFNAQDADHQFAGLDIGTAATGPAPRMSPGPGEFQAPPSVVLQSDRPGAVLRYTLDGTAPTSTNGTIYRGPIVLDKTATISAIAVEEGLAATPPATGTYILGRAIRRTSLHVGNSLTQNASAFNDHALTAGYVNTGHICGLGGAWTKKLWEGTLPPGTPTALPAGVPTYDNYRLAWARALSQLSRIDNFTMQPRDFNIPEEADYDIRFMNLLRGRSPEFQPWLYIEWTEMARRRPTDLGTEPTAEMQKVWPAATWEESMAAMVLYGEDLQHKILETYREGKRPRVLPTALALGWAHRLIEDGGFPGITPAEFYPKLFRDDVHLTTEGAFLVECTWFAAFFGESPVDKFLPVKTNLTLPQARLMQRLAWDAIKNYPDCGLYAEGTTPCGQPRFSPGPAAAEGITSVRLSSDTPGAWFRYTLDGTTPSRTRGYVYCGVISLRPGMTLKAMAYKSGMADSVVSRQLSVGRG